MLSSKGLKEIVTAARPIIERQLDDAEQIAAFRDKVANAGGDWGALKALIKAQIQDERDETGEGKRVKKILDKAGFSTDYAELLGWSNMNEKNFSADEPYDRQTGELSPKLAHTIVTGMQTQAGRAALLTAVDIMIDREENTRSDAAPASAAVVMSSSNDTAKGEAGSPVGLPDNSPETAMMSLGDGDCATVAQNGTATGGMPVTDRRDDHLNHEMDGGAISEVKAKSRLENAAGVEPPPSVATPKPARSIDELRIANALILRPNCKRPGQETCGGQGRTHCRECMAAPVEREREDA